MNGPGDTNESTLGLKAPKGNAAPMKHIRKSVPQRKAHAGAKGGTTTAEGGGRIGCMPTM